MMTMVSPKFMTCFFIYLFIFPTIFVKSNSKLYPNSSLAAKGTELSERVRKMFYHAYYNYAKYALPHDELKPLTKTFTDSLSGFENSKTGLQSGQYNGSAITLIESLSSLVIMGYHLDFKTAVEWISQNLSFDVDARINLYEWNTRVLGGLVSAHILATDLLQGTYDNCLLNLAEDLGRRFLPAFDTPTGLPYAWINLKYGVMMEETTETNTAECGSLILEMGALSRLTGDTEFESAALHALRKLWSLRSSLDLLGSRLNVVTGEWMEYSSGIGAGMDSFYETLVKAHILFGRDEFWTMFQSAYIAVRRYMRHSRYRNVDMRTGEEIPSYPASLQAVWPGIQVLIGDIASANLTHRGFYMFWRRYGVLPDRFTDKDFEIFNLTMLEYFYFLGAHRQYPEWHWMMLNKMSPTDRHYPLRPELIESTFYLYQATTDPWYLEVGKVIMDSLVGHTQVSAGFASIKDVITMNFEDHQPSYFLSETLMYLYLLFDDSFLDNDNYIFTTKGHPLPVMSPRDNDRNMPCQSWRDSVVDNRLALLLQKFEKGKKPSALSAQVCPCTAATAGDYIPEGIESACHVLDAFPDHSCSTHEECGVDLSSCIPRECSSKGYCGDGYFTNHFESIRVRDLLLEKVTGDKIENKTKIKSWGDLIGFGMSFFK